MSMNEREMNRLDRYNDLTIPNEARSMTDFEPDPELIYSTKQKHLIKLLFRRDCIQVGDFTLTSGKESPYKLNLIHAEHDVELSRVIVDSYSQVIEERLKPDIISPVFFSSVPVGTMVGNNLSLPRIIVRLKEFDENGKKVVEGFTKNTPGKNALMLDDAGTTGGSIWAAAERLIEMGVKVTDAIVLLDREEGARENLAKKGIRMHSVLRASDTFAFANAYKKRELPDLYKLVTSNDYKKVRKYLEENRVG